MEVVAVLTQELPAGVDIDVMVDAAVVVAG